MRCRTREEAQWAVARAERVFREAWGVVRHLQKTRLVPVSHDFEYLGSQVKQGTGHRLPASTRRSRSNPQNRSAIPLETSVSRVREQIRHLTQWKAPLTVGEVIERINPVLREWGTFDRKADVRRLSPRLNRWMAPRIDAFLAKHWRNSMGRP